MKKILIIGASGFVGKQLIQDFSKDYEVIGTYNSKQHNSLKKLDITNKDEVKKILEEINPDITILASAITDLNLCETNSEICNK